jgi:hypothetical protein
MTKDEQQLRSDLAVLAGSERGRRLLQLGLRGIERGERNVTAGCWVKRGDAGCLFQHAYWEGVREGVFADTGRPESFDRLARSAYADIEQHVLLPDRARLRQGAWNRAVQQLLVDTLRGSEDPSREAQAVPVCA